MINARAQNAYGLAHFAQQNHVPQVRWENVDIIGDFIKNQMAKKQLEMMDKNYELAKDQAAFAREKFDEDVRQFNVGRNTLSAKEQAELDLKNREWNEMTPYQKAQLDLEKSKINALKTTGGDIMLNNNPEYKAFVSQVNNAIKYINNTDMSQIGKKEIDVITNLRNLLGEDILKEQGNMGNLYYKFKYNPEAFAKLMSSTF